MRVTHPLMHRNLILEAKAINSAVKENLKPHASFRLHRYMGFRAVGLTIVLLAVAIATLSFFVLIGLTSIEPDRTALTIIYIANGVAVSFVLILIGIEIAALITAHRSGKAGAGLHTSMVALFCFIAVVPAIVVAVVAVLTLSQGLDKWFAERTRLALETSRLIGQSYLNEHAQVLRTDMIDLARDLDRGVNIFNNEPAKFQQILNAQAVARSLPFTFIVKANGEVAQRADINSSLPDPAIPVSELAKTNTEAPLIFPPNRQGLVGALIKLANYDNHFLFVARRIDPRVLQNVFLVEGAIAEYREQDANKSVFQLTFALTYIGLVAILLLCAVWFGLGFSNRFTRPIRDLIYAANRISHGNLNVMVDVDNQNSDFKLLGTTFNKMTSQLNSQRRELLDASNAIDQRRQFTEAMLEGVSAGVIGLNELGHVTLVNGQAEAAFNIKQQKVLGRDLAKTIIEFRPLIDQALKGHKGQAQDQASFNIDGKERVFQLRITREGSMTDSKGYVITVDDITDLVSAQRTSVWADVARRIAHEIKNPLTPIQLSAERLRRKYGERLADDREVFDNCTDTIVRQVNDIGRMVDEFSTFARMPSAAFHRENIVDIVRQAAFLFDISQPEIDIVLDLPSEPLFADIDRRLIAQIVTNLVKNASESLEPILQQSDHKGKITVHLTQDKHCCILNISDNGHGWPAQGREKLFEPYMTTRQKGTGLGLAVVAKIIEQHSGTIELLDADPDIVTGRVGAVVKISLPKQQDRLHSGTDNLASDDNTERRAG